MFCRNCGQQINEHAAFCPKCGFRVANKDPDIKKGRTSVPPSDKIAVLVSLVLAVVLTAGITVVVLRYSAGRVYVTVYDDTGATQEQEPVSDTESVQTAEMNQETEPGTAAENAPDAYEVFGTTQGIEETYAENLNVNGAEYVNLESEIEQIREWYYWTQGNLESLYRTESDGLIRYEDASGIRKILAPQGTGGIDLKREYYFADGRLYFAFVRKGNIENRFYFADDVLIRYIDERSSVYDSEDADVYEGLASGYRDEAYRFSQGQ